MTHISEVQEYITAKLLCVEYTKGSLSDSGNWRDKEHMDNFATFAL